MTEMLLGSVDNGRRATLTSAVYTGEVGVRDRGEGAVELAWFGRPLSIRAPVDGTLDGARIRVTALRSRDLTASPGLQASSNRAIVATAELLHDGG